MNHILKETPSENELDYVKQWLREESELLNSKQGFYGNWNTIEEGIADNRVFVYTLDNIAVGLVLWGEYDGCVDIQILVIHPSYRNQGIGSEFVNLLLDYFKHRNSFVVKLYCAPEESASFWGRKMGFIEFPQISHLKSQLRYYKPLILTAALCSDSSDVVNRLELFDVEPMNAAKHKPKWIWNMDGALSLNPIVLPCDINWNLRFFQNNKIVLDNSIKYFWRNSSSIIRGDFLYIDNENLNKVFLVESVR